MSYRYVLTIDNPSKLNGVTHFPPQVLYSEWYQTIRSMFPNIDSSHHATSVKLKKLFPNTELLETFLVETKLSDPALLSAIAEWNREHNITIIEQIFEDPEYIPQNPKLLD